MISNPFGLEFNETRTLKTKRGAYYCHEAIPTQAFWAAWKADKEGMKDQGYSARQWPDKNAPWKAVYWEKIETPSFPPPRQPQLASNQPQSKPKLDPWDDLTPNRRIVDYARDGKPIYQNQF